MSKKYIELEEYKKQVCIDEQFSPKYTEQINEDGKAQIVDELLLFFQFETGQLGQDLESDTTTYAKKRDLLKALLTVRDPVPIPKGLMEKLDRLLNTEKIERGRVDSVDLTPVAAMVPATKYPSADRCLLWKGDIAKLKVDAIVNAANKDMLGCFLPFHACIDNVIHCAAGPRLREDCHAIMEMQGRKEGTGLAKITRAYHLPSKFVIHTVGPIVEKGLVVQEHRDLLKECYYSCLDLAGKIPAIRSIAFCCISTGVFGFPQEPAAHIALETVSEWLDNNPGHFDQVLFNVFKQDDFDIYYKLLEEWVPKSTQ